MAGFRPGRGYSSCFLGRPGGHGRCPVAGELCAARHDAGSTSWLAIRYQPCLVSENKRKIEPKAITPISAGEDPARRVAAARTCSSLAKIGTGLTPAGRVWLAQSSPTRNGVFYKWRMSSLGSIPTEDRLEDRIETASKLVWVAMGRDPTYYALTFLPRLSTRAIKKHCGPSRPKPILPSVQERSSMPA